MIKLTKKIEYSLIALKHLGLKNGTQAATTKEMAALYQIPRELLAKLLQQLTRDGYVSSIQGPKGGYELARAPKDINFKALIETIEGESGFIDCTSGASDDCVRIADCSIRTPLLQIDKHLKDFFSQITLEDVFKGKIPVE